MGTTVYPAGLTRDQVRDREFIGLTVTARKGNWVIACNDDGRPYLCYTRITGSIASGLAVKTMTIQEGPAYGNPPRALALEYLAYFDGDADAAGGAYGAPMLREAIEGRSRTGTVTLSRGDRITVDQGDSTWSDDQPITGTYTFIKGYRFRRQDGVGVVFPKNWKRTYTWKRA